MRTVPIMSFAIGKSPLLRSRYGSAVLGQGLRPKKTFFRYKLEPVANAPWKPLIIGEGQARYQCHEIGGMSDWLGSHCWSRIRMSFNIRERDT